MPSSLWKCFRQLNYRDSPSETRACRYAKRPYFVNCHQCSAVSKNGLDRSTIRTGPLRQDYVDMPRGPVLSTVINAPTSYAGNLSAARSISARNLLNSIAHQSFFSQSPRDFPTIDFPGSVFSSRICPQPGWYSALPYINGGNQDRILTHSYLERKKCTTIFMISHLRYL